MKMTLAVALSADAIEAEATTAAPAMAAAAKGFLNMEPSECLPSESPAHTKTSKQIITAASLLWAP
jgi:hypothetical protein